jgi:hypothetical protein
MDRVSASTVPGGFAGDSTGSAVNARGYGDPVERFQSQELPPGFLIELIPGP